MGAKLEAGLEVRLEAFSGPLDLLLRLIRRKEINIYDIPVAQVAEDYMAHLGALAGAAPDMGEMSEFLVLASTLLEIKSAMLLPRRAEEPEEDPRDSLVRRLLAYEEAQALAEMLKGLAPPGDAYTRAGERELWGALARRAEDSGDSPAPAVSPGALGSLLPFSELAELFDRLVKLQEGRTDKVRAGFGQLPRDEFTVAEKISLIMAALRERGRASLFDLLAECRGKREMVVTFLALLELVRRGAASAEQRGAFADVEVTPCAA